MSNYASGYKAQIKKHIKEYTFVNYEGMDKEQAKAQANCFANEILNQMIPLPRETYVWIGDYAKYISDVGRWFMYDNNEGVWHYASDDLQFGHLVDDIIQCIYDTACEKGDLGWYTYALHFIKNPSARNNLKSSLKGSITFNVSTLKDLNQYRYRLFDNVDGTMVLMDMEADSFENAIRQVRPADIKDLNIQHKSRVGINLTSYKEPTTWLHMIEECMMQDPEKIEYMHKVLAYMMSPNNYAQAFIWWLGDKGGNGKSTVFRILQDIIGDDYSIILPSRYLLKNKIVGYKKDDDLNSMNGKSLYIYNEFEEGVELSTVAVKEITEGMGTIMVRPAYERNHLVEIKGTGVGVCNNLPPIGVNQNACPLFRRFVIVRFDHVFTNPDTSIIEKVKKEYADIQTWLYMMYFKYKGINITKEQRPADFERTITNYKADSDSVGTFFNECICTDEDGDMQYKTLYEAYAKYMNDYRQQKPLPMGSSVYKDSINHILDRFVCTMAHGTRHVKGIKLNDFYNGEVCKKLV